ncbi:uncharacterized protein METZ01_LOCUS262487, partial [marine metagenome]
MFNHSWPNKLLIMAVVMMFAAMLMVACSSGNDTVAVAAPSAPAQQPDAPAAAQAATGGASGPSAPIAAESAAAPSAGFTTAPAVEPKVNRVVIAFPGPSSEGNDSNFDFSSPPSVQLRPMYEYLVGVNGTTGAFEPQLATEWKVEPDGLGIRFKLREGIQFHNGWGEFSAQDVEHVFWSITRKDGLHGLRRTFAKDVREIEVVNDHEIVFLLNAANQTVFNGIS